jgi:hypothetical protein
MKESPNNNNLTNDKSFPPSMIVIIPVLKTEDKYSNSGHLPSDLSMIRFTELKKDVFNSIVDVMVMKGTDEVNPGSTVCACFNKLQVENQSASKIIKDRT